MRVVKARKTFIHLSRVKARKTFIHLVGKYNTINKFTKKNNRICIIYMNSVINITILHTKITTALNEAVLSYHRVRRLYFVAVVLSTTIIRDSVAL